MKKIIKNFFANFDQKILLALPYFFFSLIFIVLPLVFTFVKGLNFAQKNVSTLLHNLVIWKILLNSILTGLLASFIGTIINFAFLNFIFSFNSKIARFICFNLLIFPLVIFTLAKIWALKGFFYQVVGKSADQNLNNYFFLVFGMVYMYMPFGAIPIYLVLKDMPKNMLEASYDLGYSKVQTLFKILIPYALKSIVACFGLIFLMSATSIVISGKLLPNGSVFSLISNVILNNASSISNYQIVRVSILIMITLIFLILVYSFFCLLPLWILKRKGGLKKID